MRSILLIAVKDLRLLLRDKLASFFVLGFPVIMGVFFGLMMGNVGSNASRAVMRLALIDQDDSPISRQFVESLKKNKNLQIESDSLDAARESVRRGQRLGMLVLPAGFGETAGILWKEPPSIQLGMDPSRSAESAMIQGFIMEAMGQLIGHRFQRPQEFRPMIDEALRQVESNTRASALEKQLLRTLYQSLMPVLDSAENLQRQSESTLKGGVGAPSMQFADIQTMDVMRELDPGSIQAQVRKLRSRWDISFPQAMLWGVMGCVAGFALSIAQERTRGTMLRLRVAPLSQFQMLSGKAAACFLATMGVIVALTILGVLLGMRPLSYPKLIVAALFVAFCFVGIMMTMATLGKSEEAVGGIGWAINMVMAMFGGCMIPVMFMPAFVQKLSVLSPVYWSIRSLEGAIWRDFGWGELLLPFTVLVLFGMAGLLLGHRILAREV